MFFKPLCILSFFFAACMGTSQKTTNMESGTTTTTTATKSFHDFSAKSIEGSQIDFSQYKGKKVLLVNTASECGFTGQYKDLQALQDKYTGKLVVLGFPSNQFGGQEPGNSEQIKSFCSKTYQVSFQLFEKADVKGAAALPVYKWLADKNANGVLSENPSWNFCKFLIDENGKVIKYFSSRTSPMSEDITKYLQ